MIDVLDLIGFNDHSEYPGGLENTCPECKYDWSDYDLLFVEGDNLTLPGQWHDMDCSMRFLTLLGFT